MAESKRYWMITDAGTQSSVSFLYSNGLTRDSILWRSAGGTAQTRDYKTMLTVLLSRAAKLGLQLRRVAVETATTQGLSLDDRTLDLTLVTLPSVARSGSGVILLDRLSAGEIDAVRQRLGTLGASIGRPAGAKGGGNTSRSLRLYFQGALNEDQLETLAGRRSESAAA